MPRGKYVNHKGRSRHFTSPEELQRESESDEESSSAEEEGAAAGGSNRSQNTTNKAKTSRVGKMPTSSEEEDDDTDDEPDKDAKKGVASLIEIENPNRVVKKTAVKVGNLSINDPPQKPELTRREREELEKQRNKKRYEELHAAGKTSEAKADLARLALIRQQRAEAAAKREAEKKALEEKKTTSKA